MRIERGTCAFSVLDVGVQVRCQDAEARDLLAVNFGALPTEPASRTLGYTVERDVRSGAFFVQKEGAFCFHAPDPGTFVFLFEQDLVIQLQRIRRDLYFVHSAVLEDAGQAFMLAAPSGSGKSGTTWALLHQGFRYLSDELAPVDLVTLDVHPYPHALCVKRPPPPPYSLPRETVDASARLLVPPATFPHGHCASSRPVSAIFFLRYAPEMPNPSVRPLGVAEAGARLFANALNPLAHPGAGLDGAISIAVRCARFELLTSDVSATCELVKRSLREHQRVRAS